MREDRLLEEIKARTDILDLISDYVQMKKAGQNWKGLCPFHSEKTPSFTVNPSKQIFHCFGCGAGGDVIGFIMKYENLSFKEALETLAKKAGIPLNKFKTGKKSEHINEQIRDILSDANIFYRKKLKESKQTIIYLEKRGLNQDSIDKFQLGYAPGGWNNLLKYLKEKGHDEQLIKKSGLSVFSGKGHYDMFRERIMFPIMGMTGNVIAFGGRVLDDSKPKYLNSPETLIFKKSDTLYGLYTAKEEIRKKDSVMIVEGYIDVIICHQYGFKNVIAPLGTALTSGHLQRIRKMTANAVLIFDGDTAGITAAKRSLAELSRNDFNIKVLMLPQGEDPDSYLRKYGANDFARQIENAYSIIDFILSTSNASKTSAVREALAIIAGMSDILMVDDLIREISEKSRLSEIIIREEFKKIKKSFPSTSAKLTTDYTRLNNEEYLLLSALIAFPEKSGYILTQIENGDIRDRTVYSLIRKIGQLREGKDLSSILDDSTEDEKLLFTRLSVNPGFDLDYADRNIEDCLNKIKIRKIQERIKKAETSGDLKLLHTLLIEKKKMIEGKSL